MPVYKPDGSQGLLAKGEFGSYVEKKFPSIEINDEDIADPMVAASLYGQYSMLASAYLLEPCHLQIMETGNTYGKGRDHVPQHISVPLAKLSKAI